MTRAKVVCIGNSLVADDGVGAAVYAALTKQPLPPSTVLVQLGVSGIDLVEQFAREDICVFVDAATSNDEPGTIRITEPPRATTATAISAHDIGVAEALAIVRVLYPEREPQRAVLVTVAGDCFDELRPTLSPAVEAAIPQAVEAIVKLIHDTGAN